MHQRTKILNKFSKHGVLTILLYHGVTNISSEGIENYSGKHCKQEEFASQMGFVKKECNVLSMQDVIEHYLDRQPFPVNAVAVTFDDSFKNNFTVAAPILDDLNVPATFYLSTGFIGSEKMFWVDILEDCINRCIEKEIELDMGNGKNVFSLETVKLRVKSLKDIKDYCKSAESIEKDRIINLVQEVTNVKPSIDSSENYLKMNWGDVFQLDSNPLFIIGGHSVNHNILAALHPDDMREEIYQSVNELQNRLNHKVEHYSYPEGQWHHYNREVISCLKEMGIKCCPSAIDGVNYLEDDLFHLKRIMVGFDSRPFPFHE